MSNLLRQQIGTLASGLSWDEAIAAFGVASKALGSPHRQWAMAAKKIAPCIPSSDSYKVWSKIWKF
jgi:hypothetical protein